MQTNNLNLNKYISEQAIIYFIISIIILHVIKKKDNNYSYMCICLCLCLSIYLYISKFTNANVNTTNNINITTFNNKVKYLSELEINSDSLISNDNELIEILYIILFIKVKSGNHFTKLINYLEDFLVTFETLKQNKNNIFLKSVDIIKPFKLSPIHQSLLINDIRDQFERILKHIYTFIHIIQNDNTYLNTYYQFNQLIRSHLSRYYNRILSDYNYNDHTSEYQLIRSSENKYDWIDA